MAKIYIDNKSYEATEGKNLLETCLSLGLDLPYFCWHPKLGSVGACRQCAVKLFKDENDTRGKIVMACMEPVKDSMRISLEDPEIKQFHGQVIEGLMTNHPHDCPTCDEGGQCHLQDITVMTGHDYRRYRFNKRTHENQNLGPFINHEMNRCIACYRCVRFYKDYAGGNDLDVFSAHNHVYFGRHENGPLESEFSGNLVEVCPTGVFTDKTVKKHYTRKWDMTTAPSICNQCSLGCNTIAGERYGTLRSVTSRYNGEVNGYFICDRGRFGYEYMNGDDRIKKPAKRDRNSREVTYGNAADMLNQLSLALKNSSGIIGIGSPRASLESNFALKKLVGNDRFYTGMSDTEHDLVSLAYDILQNSPAKIFSLKEVEKADAVLVLGEDLTNTAPMLDLAIHQSIKNKPLEKAKKISIPEWNDKAVREIIQDDKGPFYLAVSVATKLDNIATKKYNSVPDDIARYGFAVAHELDKNSPEVKSLNKEILTLAKETAEALKNAEHPLIISGTGSKSEEVLKAAANIAKALHSVNKNAGICLTLPEANSLGLAMTGGQHLTEAFQTVENEKADAVIILENDLYRRAEESLVNGFLEKCKNVIVLDYNESKTTRKADFIFPAAPVAESNGTLVNNEGRAQRFFQVFAPEQTVQAGWRWIQAISSVTGTGSAVNFENLTDVISAIENEIPVLSGINQVAPPPGFRIAGQRIPRESHRFSGRTAMYANQNVSEPKPPEDTDTAMTYTMEGYNGIPPSSMIPRFWSPGWNSVQAINRFQIEVGGPLHGGDPGKRLIESPEKETQENYYTEIPGAFQPKDSEWLILPVYHIFGSEELSGRSLAIRERAPKPYLAMGEEEAGKLLVDDGTTVEVTIHERKYKLPVQIRKGMPAGTAGLPVGLTEILVNKFPVTGKIQKV